MNIPMSNNAPISAGAAGAVGAASAASAVKAPEYALNKILPRPIFDHTGARILAYRNYPVFSWAWFGRRAALAAGISLIFALLVALAMRLSEPKHSAALEALHIFLAFAKEITLPIICVLGLLILSIFLSIMSFNTQPAAINN